MAIKQRGTPLDAILLEVVYPLLFRSRLRRVLQRLQLWHTEVPPARAPEHVINLVTDASVEEALEPPPQILSHKRAA